MQRAERIFRVHHVEEREARVGPRSRQKLKERPVRGIVRIAVARADRVARRAATASAPAEIAGWNPPSKSSA